MEGLAAVMLLVSGILLILLGIGKTWRPFAWLSLSGLMGRIALILGVVDIIVAVMMLA